MRKLGVKYVAACVWFYTLMGSLIQSLIVCMMYCIIDGDHSIVRCI